MPNFCSQCGASIDAGTRFCGKCGKPAQQEAPPPQHAPTHQYAAPAPPPQYAPPAPQYNAPPQSAPLMSNLSSKSKIVAALLAFFLGSLGAHRFYVGRAGTAVLQLLMLIVGYVLIAVASIQSSTGIGAIGGVIIFILGLWILIDFIMILVGKFKDKNGLPLK